MKHTTVVRKAVSDDAPAIRSIVNSFAGKGAMLALSLNQIYERLRDFWVVQDTGRIVACGSLRVIWKQLGEIRSLAVLPKYQKLGYATILLQHIVKEAAGLGLRRVFVLTYVPRFFEKFGFQVIPRHKLPHKIWLDCINCPKFPRCDETAMIREV